MWSPRRLALIVGLAASGRAGERRWSSLLKRTLRPELATAVATIGQVAAAFAKDIRNGRTDHHPMLLNLLVLNTLHEREAAAICAEFKDRARAAAAAVPAAFNATAFAATAAVAGDGSRGRRGRPAPTSCRSAAAAGSAAAATDEDVLRQAARYVRFASSAYGLFMLKGLQIMAQWPPLGKVAGREASRDELDRWCVVTHTGVAEEDLVRLHMSKPRDLHLPAYYVAVDRESQSVVLAIRGTMSAADAVTDLICSSSEYLGGYAHRGMSQGAAMVLADAKDALAEQLLAHPGYRLVLCGHSMGGGVATLLALHLKRNPEALGTGIDVPVICFSYGPPPVFAPAEANAKTGGGSGDSRPLTAGGTDPVAAVNESGPADAGRATGEGPAAVVAAGRRGDSGREACRSGDDGNGARVAAAMAMTEDIHSFVYRHDLVSRLSLANAYKLFRSLQEIDALPVGFAARCRYVLHEMRPQVTIENTGLALPAVRVSYRYATKLARGVRRGVGGRGGIGNIFRRGGEGGSEGGWSSCSSGGQDAAAPGRKGGRAEQLLQAFVQQHMDRDAEGREAARRGRGGGGPAAGTVDAATARRDADGDSDVSGTYPDLQIPGNVYWLSCSRKDWEFRSGGGDGNGGDHGGGDGCCVVKVGPEEFNKILLVDTAVIDHWPSSYEFGFRALLAQLGSTAAGGIGGISGGGGGGGGSGENCASGFGGSDSSGFGSNSGSSGGFGSSEVGKARRTKEAPKVGVAGSSGPPTAAE